MKSVTTIVCALLMMLILIPDNGLAQSDEDINTRIENLVSQWQKTLPIYNQAMADGKVPNCVKSW